jgi:hypothetical protein
VYILICKRISKPKLQSNGRCVAASRYSVHATLLRQTRYPRYPAKLYPYTQCSHGTQYTAHSTQHTAHSTQHTAHSTQHTAHSTQHTAHSTKHTAHNFYLFYPFIIQLVLCVCSVWCVVRGVWCVVCGVWCLVNKDRRSLVNENEVLEGLKRFKIW